MAFVYVQYWHPLPIIYEGLTPATPARSQPTYDLTMTAQDPRANAPQVLNSSLFGGNEASGGVYSPPSSIAQGSYSNMPQFQQQPPPGRQDSFGMGSLGSALPEAPYQNYGNPVAQRYSTGASPSPNHHPQHNPQYAAPLGMNHTPAAMPYNMPYQNQYHGMYTPGQTPSPSNMGAGISPGGQFYQAQGFVGSPQPPGSPYYLPSGHYPMQAHMYGAGQYAMRGVFPADNRISAQPRESEYLGGGGSAQGRTNSIASNNVQSSVVRGPPRKPRQSGHAIWIGNLPPHSDLMSLVLHVCKEAPGLESLFLISKSNCAFANFKDEESCTVAQAKIHDSRFQTVRLVSRLRRSSVGTAAGVSAPTAPAALTPPSNVPVAITPSESDAKIQKPSVETNEVPESEETESRKDKFFVVKSLTVEDLELSVRNGIWATQSHNEDSLNKAYQTADNVYLIFSANKSGEYFGYAKMISPINDDPAAAIEFAPKAHTVEDPELPKAIPTQATEFAPKGRIIDDSARGTIFWEAERDGSEGSEEEDDVRSTRSEEDTESSPKKAWGKPFKVEWMSTNRLPFYRTRGLRNPWNSNREVKIARDGTELETAIGRRLLGLFHRLPSPVSTLQGGVPIIISGYPSMRSYS